MSEDQISNLVTESLAAVGLKGVEDQLPSELSGGMKKGVALARSIICDTTNAAIEPEVRPTVCIWELDCFNDIHNTTYVDEVQSISFSQASIIPQTQTQSQGSSKRKKKSTNNAEALLAGDI